MSFPRHRVDRDAPHDQAEEKQIAERQKVRPAVEAEHRVADGWTV
jgi:hypothetical protein